MPQANHITKPPPYASSGDFHRIFDEETDSLYRLAFVLTADREKADQCVVSGLEDSVKGKPGFSRNGHDRGLGERSFRTPQRMINPRPVEEGYPSGLNVGGRTSGQKHDGDDRDSQPRAVRPIRLCDVGSRALFRSHECSVLLGCSRRDVIAARNRALEEIVSVRVHLEQIDPSPEKPESHDNRRSLLEDLLHV